MSTDTTQQKVSDEYAETVTKWIQAVQEAAQSLPDGTEWKLAAEHSASWLSGLIASEQPDLLEKGQEAANAS